LSISTGGGKKLGVPTANHPQFDTFLKEKIVVNGVYFGWGRVAGEPLTGIIANVGYSPTFIGEVNMCSIVFMMVIYN
jgi:FAD synthase